MNPTNRRGRNWKVAASTLVLQAMQRIRMDPQSYASRLGDYKVLIGIHGEHVGYGAVRPTDEDVRDRG